MRRKKLAELAHEMWSSWMKYLFSKGQFNEDGTWTMPAWAVERWQRQMNTSYDDLSEEEKESDIKEAEKIMSLLESVPRDALTPFQQELCFLHNITQKQWDEVMEAHMKKTRRPVFAITELTVTTIEDNKIRIESIPLEMVGNG